MKTPKKKPTSAVEIAAAPPLPVKNRVFTLEFKRAAVERMQQGDTSATALALELGIRRNLLYKWAKSLEGTVPGQPLRGRGRVPADQESEVVRLRRKLAIVEEERDILKKFHAYLTQQQK